MSETKNPYSGKNDRERNDAYLAEATDLYDLEFRMRKIDRDAQLRKPSWMSQH